MSAAVEIESFVAPQPPHPTAPDFARLLEPLQEAFDASFAVWNAETGELLAGTPPNSNDSLLLSTLVRAVHGRHPHFVADDEAIVTLAIPLEGPGGQLL